MQQLYSTLSSLQNQIAQEKAAARDAHEQHLEVCRVREAELSSQIEALKQAADAKLEASHTELQDTKLNEVSPHCVV